MIFSSQRFDNKITPQLHAVFSHANALLVSVFRPTVYKCLDVICIEFLTGPSTILAVSFTDWFSFQTQVPRRRVIGFPGHANKSTTIRNRCYSQRSLRTLFLQRCRRGIHYKCPKYNKNQVQTRERISCQC